LDLESNPATLVLAGEPRPGLGGRVHGSLGNHALSGELTKLLGLELALGNIVSEANADLGGIVGEVVGEDGRANGEADGLLVLHGPDRNRSAEFSGQIIKSSKQWAHNGCLIGLGHLDIVEGDGSITDVAGLVRVHGLAFLRVLRGVLAVLEVLELVQLRHELLLLGDLVGLPHRHGNVQASRVDEVEGVNEIGAHECDRHVLEANL